MFFSPFCPQGESQKSLLLWAEHKGVLTDYRQFLRRGKIKVLREQRLLFTVACSHHLLLYLLQVIDIVAHKYTSN